MSSFISIFILLAVKLLNVQCDGNDLYDFNYGDGYGEEWIYFPDGDGVPHHVSLVPTEDEYFLLPRGMVSEIEYRLYTNDKENYTLLDETAEPTNPVNVNYSKPFKIITHGWRSSIESDAVAGIKNAYIDAKSDVNIITIDWSYTAGSIFYHWVVNQTLNIGTEVGSFIKSLSEKHKVTGHNIHLIGHSLGAHVMGIASYYSNLKVDRITGLDPARPLFEYPHTRDDTAKLDISDANFIDIIHTCGGVLGYENSLGTVDFYPNSGIPPQPGCNTLPKILEACSHGRSYRYYAESITNPRGFPSYQCGNWTDYLENRCEDSTYMGEHVDRNINGNFYLKTNSREPYGRIEGLLNYFFL